METVTVDLGERSYPIQIGHGILDALGPAYVERGLGKTAAIVTNPTVAKRYLEPVRESLTRAGVSVCVVTMPDGEAHKTLETASSLYGDLIQLGLDRGSCVVALGGGVVGDTAGFLAATYQRGIDYVQVPTTIVSQVDASVGGKTAVDHPLGKNMIGAFHQPRLVFIDTETLATLPERELRAGMAEVIKHGLIRDPDLVTFLEENLDAVVDLEIEPDRLDWLIAQNCRIKAGVVTADETEKGLREILNYGHTVGHAVEVMTNYDTYKHGEAVGLAMIAAGKIALDRGMWTAEEYDRQQGLLQRIGIPKGAKDLPSADLIDRMGRDKKARSGVIRFVLPETIGKVVSCDEVTREEMVAGIRAMQEASGSA